MTMMGGRFPQGKEEVGQTVADFPTYEAAQKAVSSLIAGEVPARQIAIVGKGLRSIERVTGRLGYASAARSGAVNGLLLGLFFAAILVLGSPSVPIQAFVGVLFVGIAIGMLMSLVTYAIVRRRRDFASVMQVIADHYEVTVAADNVHKARQVLGVQATVAARPEQPQTRTSASEPPRYGERIASASDTHDASVVSHGEGRQGDAPAPGADAPQEGDASARPGGDAESPR